MRITNCFLLGLTIALLAGCGESSTDTTTAASTSEGDGPAWLLANVPEGLLPVAEVKSSAKEGDEVVIRGRIGGRLNPMSTEIAVFMMMDSSIDSCADEAEENCATPWDYCCESPESITSNLATVQLVDKDGTPLAIDLQQFGIEPLDEVVVIGTVGPRPTEEVLTINATKIHLIDG